MTTSPLPRHGSTLLGRDKDGRRLRVSSHPDAGRVVLSIWQDDICRATFRLAEEDVPELVKMLSSSLIQPLSEESEVCGLLGSWPT
ncbi:MAG TPA: hypothetical protein VIM01_16260 [Dermatophilaceae bacterium]